MQDRGVDALVASSTENVYYVSDYWSLGKKLGCGVDAYVVLPLNNDPAIIAPMNEADLIIYSGTWIDDLRFYGEPNVDVGEVEEPSEQTESLLKIHKETKTETDGTSALLKVLEDLGVNKGVIALDTSDLSPAIFEHIKGKIPDSKIIDGSSLLREIRQVKTQPEVERILRATEITEKSMEDALEIARSEISELDLAGMFTYSVTYDGGQVSQNLIGIGERSAYPNPVPSINQAKRRDLLRLTLGCTWGHYHSNISRTGVIGRPLGKAQRLWEAVQGAQDSVLDIIKPGVKLSELYAEAEKELAKTEVKIRTPSIGHGLGVECNERPWIEREGEAELLEGMVVNVDIPILELGWGGLQIEDTILVTGDGCELLTKTDRGLYLL
jgi:Xaa-Pro aminopeptidase